MCQYSLRRNGYELPPKEADLSSLATEARAFTSFA